MAGPASPGTEGPTFEPPQLPPGWIAQWDGASKKYYFVSISTGVSQWETPNSAAPGGTPAQQQEHPYGVPKPELITHPDGTQTVRHADGRMEPVLPPGDGTRGVGGETGDRSIGSFASNMLMNQISGGHGKQSNNSGGHGSSPLGGIAGQLLGGLSGSNSHGNSQSNSHSSGGNNGAGKLVGALASSLFSSGGKTEHQQPQNYHGGQSSTPQQSGGFAGSVMGGVANMFGGSQGHSKNQNYGYSNAGQSGGYTGQAPPTSYQPSGQSTAAYSSPPPGSQHAQHGTPSYGAATGQQHGAPSYTAPPTQHGGSYSSPPPGQQSQGYGHHSPAPQGQHYSQQPAYVASSGVQHPQHPAPYGGQHQQYSQSQPNYNQQYGQVPAPPGGQPPYQPAYGHQNAPAVPSGSHPHYGQHGHHPGGYPGQW
ncbi:hypothetical protein AB5N19_09885 [Seiridium cardinale]|uniref:WW domain-containing protein n=1 Tax=Seiridium cardinale TaxID=138064 RepID=A0ABR2Y9Q2_9PEZI